MQSVRRIHLTAGRSVPLRGTLASRRCCVRGRCSFGCRSSLWAARLGWAALGGLWARRAKRTRTAALGLNAYATASATIPALPSSVPSSVRRSAAARRDAKIRLTLRLLRPEPPAPTAGGGARRQKNRGPVPKVFNTLRDCGAESVHKVFPQCSEECTKAQLRRGGHKGVTNDTPLNRKSEAPKAKVEDLAKFRTSGKQTTRPAGGR